MHSLFPPVSDVPGRVLVVGSEPWWVRSIKSVFEPSSYEIYTASSGELAVQHLHRSAPEAAIIHGRREDGHAIGLVRWLRREGLGAACPVILISEVPLRREERLQALRAGAWDCLSVPFGGEELLLKVESYLGAKRSADRAREQVLVDERSGLYNLNGILRWARELGQSARRYHRPFGCAVFAPVADGSGDVDETSPGASPGEGDDLARRIATRLVTQARTSDIMGRLSENEYIVLAPETGPKGIITLASRFVAESDSGPPTALRLRAGCFAVADLARESVEPAQIIAQATLALRRTQNRSASDMVEFFDARPPNSN